MKKIANIILLFLVFSCNNDKPGVDQPSTPTNPPAAIGYSIINTYPHDTSFFTEGLVIYKGDLYESTGNYGKSKLAKVNLVTGKTEKELNLDQKYFGEGIAILNDTIYQLTYMENVGFMYSLKDFRKISEFKFASKEGWGMTTDGKYIIASDGGSNLYYYEPSTFRLARTQGITEAGSPAFNLNELEYIDGYIYANQWQYPYILKIDPADGKVVGKIDLRQITDNIRTKYPFAEYMNGIAYDITTKKMYITGKHWPDLYEIELSR